MSSWLLLLLLALLLVVGVSIGVLLQRSRVPGRALRRASYALASAKVSMTRPQDGLTKLNVRDFQHADDPKQAGTERDGRHVSYTLDVAPSELALILIDVWSDHPIKGWAERAEKNVATKLLPLVESARKYGIMVVHCPHGESPHPLVRPLTTELVIDDRGEKTRLVQALQQRGIRRLLYAGYASNMCILTRPVGIIEMSQQGDDIIFVRDASLAIEAPDFLETDLTHQVATYMVETNWGVSTSVDDVLEALDR